jgi:hypothetical protein
MLTPGLSFNISNSVLMLSNSPDPGTIVLVPSPPVPDPTSQSRNSCSAKKNSSQVEMISGVAEIWLSVCNVPGMASLAECHAVRTPGYLKSVSPKVFLVQPQSALSPRKSHNITDRKKGGGD